MCGIAGIVERPGAEADEARLGAMAGSMAHRGPDDEGVVARGQAGLAHRRLSILDTSSRAHQPMSNADGSVWIAFNGEIYNFRELRDQLPSDPPYRSTSDTEVLLRAYETWGIDCLPRLNGMFGFAILDTRKQELIVVRDRFGIKPVYYAQDDQRFYFGSEVKAILAGGLARAYDTLAAVDFAYSGLTANNRHFCKGVKRLPPGHYLRVRFNDPQIERVRYFRPLPDWSYVDRLGKSESQWMDAIEEKLISSIDYRMVSDVPLGTYCSGGIDSSLITAITAQKHNDLHAFNVSMPDSPGHDEGPTAERVAKHVGATLHTFPLTRESFRKAFVQTVYITEYPLSFVNAVPLYLVSQLARDEGIRVLLSGEGADELFGGYVRQMRANAWIRVARSKGKLFNFLFHRGIGVLNRVNNKLGLPAFSYTKDNFDMHRLLIGNADVRYMADEAFEIYDRYDDPLDRHLAAGLWCQLQAYILPILHRTDRASMTASVEARVPFLDHRMVELALAVPPEFKVQPRGFSADGKAILKKVATRYIPHDIVYQPKVGFEVPLSYYSGPWPKSWLNEGFVTEQYGLEPGRLEWWLGRAKDQSLAWMLSLEVWGQIYMRGRSVADVTEEFLKAG